LKQNLRLEFVKIVMCHCSKLPDESLEQVETRRDSSLALMISN